MSISWFFWPILLYYIISRMMNLRDGGGGPHSGVLWACGLTIIALIVLGGWHDLKLVVQ